MEFFSSCSTKYSTKRTVGRRSTALEKTVQKINFCVAENNIKVEGARLCNFQTSQFTTKVSRKALKHETSKVFKYLHTGAWDAFLTCKLQIGIKFYFEYRHPSPLYILVHTVGKSGTVDGGATVSLQNSYQAVRTETIQCHVDQRRK